MSDDLIRDLYWIYMKEVVPKLETIQNIEIIKSGIGSPRLIINHMREKGTYNLELIFMVNKKS